MKLFLATCVICAIIIVGVIAFQAKSHQSSLAASKIPTNVPTSTPTSSDAPTPLVVSQTPNAYNVSGPSSSSGHMIIQANGTPHPIPSGARVQDMGDGRYFLRKQK